MEAYDIQQDSTGDLEIFNGDFRIDVSDQQHIEDIIGSFKGSWKEFPTVGVGIRQYLNASGAEQQIEREIKIQLQQDGYSVSSPRVSFDSSGTLNISPNAIRN